MLRGAIIGTGFWANYQIPAWQESADVEIVAVCNRTRSKAEAIARKFKIPNVYDRVDQLLEHESLDFVDIITDVDTHPLFVQQAAEKGVHVICQKPMAPSFALAEGMVDICRKAGVKFFVHENFRWQMPIRKLKSVLDSGLIGRPFKARVSFCSGFPVFENQPFLADLEQFILTDIGSHVLDVSRFLFGEAQSLYCQTARVNPAIRGEDVANVFMKMQNGLHCYTEMSYASVLEKESFPQTLVLVEGEKGSAHLTHDFVLKITTRKGTETIECTPTRYDWLDPEYAVVHSSIVDCNRNILIGLRGGKTETTGDDNFETVKLVFAAYESARLNQALEISALRL